MCFFVVVFLSRIKTSKRQIMMGDQILLPTVCWWPFVPWFCGLKLHACVHFVIPKRHLRHLHTTVSFHTMQNWNCLLYCRWIWVFLDVYKLQSSFSLYSLIHTCKSWSHRYGYIYIILYFKIGAFYFRFCSSTKSDVCIPSYIWIYITIIYYLFSLSSFRGSLICKRSHLKLEVCLFSLGILFNMILTLYWLLS